MSLDVLSAAIGELDPSALGDGESIIALHRELARLQARVAEATAVFDASKRWQVTSARSAAAWITTECRMRRQVAARHVRLGRAMRHLPMFAAQWSSGNLTADHLAVIVHARNERTAEALARDEQMLVERALTLRFSQFERLVDYWAQHTDPDGAEHGAEDKHARRDVYLAESFQGMFLGKITLDPISGVIVSDELTRIEKRMFEADWAQAAERLGHTPTIADLARTPTQRRADALVEMAIRSASAGPTRRPRPLFSVLVDVDTLSGRVCQLANGTVLTPGQLVAWLTQADIERAVWAPDGRVEVSKRSRFFTGATRRAIELRDRHCTDPYCEEPLNRCQVDHIIPYDQGGGSSKPPKPTAGSSAATTTASNTNNATATPHPPTHQTATPDFVSSRSLRGMLEVRHASADEAAVVLHVWAAADAEPTVTDDERAIRALLDHAPDALLVAVDGTRLVGTLIVGWDGWRGSFYRLAVVPDRRLEGIARMLVEEGERQLAQLGARRLAIIAVTRDPGAVAFWKAVGYELQSGRERLIKNLA